jgi:D-glycero-alpha-D-manno-heptose-7-phosphate kinase
MIIRSKAPLRISFGGGGTDVSPYPEQKGGVVLCSSIDKYVYCTLKTNGTDVVNVKSLDYDTVASYRNIEDFRYDGKLDLVKATIRVMKVGAGFDIFLHADSPPGSGLGTSSTITVALIGLFKHWRNLPMDDYEVAELAYHIEREEVKLAGGKQDQYAAAFGGFNFIEFFPGNTVVNPLRIKEDVLNELQYRLMLCYTGTRRLSTEIIEDQVGRYTQGAEDTVHALNEVKVLALEMKKALLLGRIDDFGALLHESWSNKKKFSARMTTPDIDEMYEAARQQGVIGGKLLGAGGGGYLLLLCEFDKWHVVAERMEKLGGAISPVTFEPRGLQTWEVK